MPTAIVDLSVSSEETPLLGSVSESRPSSRREELFAFLEAKTHAGRVYEQFTIILIVVNVFAFILATLFVEKYNPAPWAQRDGGICGNLCDALWFGNYRDNGLQFLRLGTTSILEIITILVWSVDYVARISLADLESEAYQGIWGRIRYLFLFFSLVDLVSTVPFYLDVFVVRQSDLVASQFLRMFRLFRMMRVEGRYATALTMFDDVFYTQRGLLGTALFIGVTTWITISSLYYIVERRSTDMIYCGAAPDYCGEGDAINTALCTIDTWGITDCSAAGCPPTDDFPEPCYNLFKSIPMASYYFLLNMFGDFPLIDQHSATGKIVSTLVAFVTIAVFALPTGILGSGFEDLIEQRRAKEPASPVVEEPVISPGFIGDTGTLRGRIYNFLHSKTSYGSIAFDLFIDALTLGTALTFMIGTVGGVSPGVHVAFGTFELFSVIIFTVEYVLRVYASREDPKYRGPNGRLCYMTKFLPIVNLLAVAPYWMNAMISWYLVTPRTDMGSNIVKFLRLLRILRFERYTHAFTSFDDVIRRNLDVLTITGFTALLFWVLFAAILYFTERNNPDSEMASNYNTVPNSMWITLLNLAGESPLAHYSLLGKITTGIIGLFATALFGIPIGVLGAGFEEIVTEENKDTPDGVDMIPITHAAAPSDILGSSMERSAFQFVNGIGSRAAQTFELSIYALILLSILVGFWQTVDGHEDSFSRLEWFAVLVFTLEYLVRFIGAAADPEFGNGNNWFMSRLRYSVSFYSVIDLLAIVPFYLALAMPNSWVDDNDEYLRMFRLFRLIKLDKYIPSITLIDDVIRLKRNSLIVAAYAAVTLWVIFGALLFLTEHRDSINGIDNVPQYGCDSDCTMMDRFQNYFDSMIYTAVHLTGYFPIFTYTWPARFVNMFMVVAAVGVVAVPSGLIASGFIRIVQSKFKKRKGKPKAGQAGDDWYEHRLRALEGKDPPPSRFGPTVDRWQVAVNEFLNGHKDERTGVVWTVWSRMGRIFMFTVIITNVLAVLLESVPEIDRLVGNRNGNFFDVFEAFSVMVFTWEYMLRLFCAPKNRGALFSTFIYATTFFGIVDLMSTAPWFIEHALIASGHLDASGDNAKTFRIFRIFRILQLEDFLVAFSKLDNVFRASKDVLKATGLLALIIWVGCGALFFIFEENNPNWRLCDMSIPDRTEDGMGCYDFLSTKRCNDVYPGLCHQKAFTNVPNSLYYTAVFLVGNWGVIDFTWPGRIVCLFLCVLGIALYAIPVGTLFDSFGAVLGSDENQQVEVDEEGARNSACGQDCHQLFEMK